MYLWHYSCFCQTETFFFCGRVHLSSGAFWIFCMSCLSAPLVAACRRTLATGRMPARALYKHLQAVLSNSSEGCSHSQMYLIIFNPAFFLVSMVVYYRRIILQLCAVWKITSFCCLIVHWLLRRDCFWDVTHCSTYIFSVPHGIL